MRGPYLGDVLRLEIHVDLQVRIEADRVADAQLLQDPGQLGCQTAAVAREVLDECLGTLRASQEHQHLGAAYARELEWLSRGAASLQPADRVLPVDGHEDLRAEQGNDEVFRRDLALLGSEELTLEVVLGREAGAREMSLSSETGRADRGWVGRSQPTVHGRRGAGAPAEIAGP